MASKMIWHDTRLLGNPPTIAPNTHTVNDKSPLMHSITWIAAYAEMNGGLDDLFLMCHGLVVTTNTATQQSQLMGGYGLQVCKENLTLQTVSLTRFWTGAIGVITLYACAPGLTTGQTRGSLKDGEIFCKKLAMITQAEVIASEDIQYYNGAKSTINFGSWEGIVHRYLPDGSRERLQ